MSTMQGQRIYRYIYILLISFFSVAAVNAEDEKGKVAAPEMEKMPLLSGFAVSADLVGVSMKLVGARFANMEIAGKLNLKEKYFPVFEIGIGDCTRRGGENSNKFSTSSPYYRIGVDYNVNKKTNGNRFLVGARYGFSSYKFDYTADGLEDPVYSTSQPLDFHGLKARQQWLEFALGFEAKIWKLVRLGWNLRYKMRINQSVPEYGEPYFVPGYGKNDVSTFGGSVNLLFDFGKGSWKNRKHAKKLETIEAHE